MASTTQLTTDGLLGATGVTQTIGDPIVLLQGVCTAGGCCNAVLSQMCKHAAAAPHLWPISMGTALTGVTVLEMPTSPVLAPLRAPWPGAVDAGLLLAAPVAAVRPLADSGCFVVPFSVFFAASTVPFLAGAAGALGPWDVPSTARLHQQKDTAFLFTGTLQLPKHTLRPWVCPTV
jgi:hypothetical protein